MKIAINLLIVLLSLQGIFGFDNSIDSDIDGRNCDYFLRMFSSYYKNHSVNWTEKDKIEAGKPLFLTPLIEAHQIQRARALSSVKLPSSETKNLKSYSGFFTVNKKYQSNIFFWFFPATKAPSAKAPILLWLQGGPGGSSMFGLFVENGPIKVNVKKQVELRDIGSWAENYNVIYIDQPVGTGFSFTKSNQGYANNQDDVSRDLYEALRQFFLLFPELSKNDFYVTGESYAGKYVPSICYKIQEMNANTGTKKINLKGMAIGDGLSDPFDQLNFGDFLFQTGLVDESIKEDMRGITITAQYEIDQKNWGTANNLFGMLIESFSQSTGLKFYYNYLLQNQPDSFAYYVPYLNLPSVRNSIHVGNLTFDEISNTVYKHLYQDMMKSVKPKVESLLESGIKVMIYNGQLDVIVGYPLTENYISKLKWKGSTEYADAQRKIWRVGNEVAGYVRSVKNFRQVMVRNAGHILPYDQPKWAHDMIDRFIQDKPF